MVKYGSCVIFPRRGQPGQCVQKHASWRKGKHPQNLSVWLLLRQNPFGSIFRKLKWTLATTPVLHPQTCPLGLKGFFLGQSSWEQPPDLRSHSHSWGTGAWPQWLLAAGPWRPSSCKDLEGFWGGPGEPAEDLTTSWRPSCSPCLILFPPPSTPQSYVSTQHLEIYFLHAN